MANDRITNKTEKTNNCAKIISAEYAQVNFDEILEKIAITTRDASLKILDTHNKAILECEIDILADKIRSDIGDNIAFEIFMGDLYNEFNSNPSPSMAEKIIDRLRTSKYYKIETIINKRKNKNNFRSFISKLK